MARYGYRGNGGSGHASGFEVRDAHNEAEAVTIAKRRAAAKKARTMEEREAAQQAKAKARITLPTIKKGKTE